MDTEIKWNVMVFYVNTNNEGVVDMFDVEPKDLKINFTPEVTTITDRTRCKVLILSERNGTLTIDTPFVSHFFDPLVYAKHLLKFNFVGVIVKDNHPFMDTFVDLCVTIAKKNIEQGTAVMQLIAKEMS